MDYQAGLTKRLEDTKALREVNNQAIAQAATIRKLAMRSNPVTTDTLKWLVRTLVDALNFKNDTLDLWIDDDTAKLQKILETGQIPITSEPQLDLKEPATAVTPAEVAEAAETIPEEEIPETVPAEPEPEGIDKVFAILDAK